MDLMALWQNPNGIDMCLEMNMPMSWSNLSANSNPWAIARLLQHPDNIIWEVGVTNPGLPFREHVYHHHWMHAAANPNDEYVERILTAPSLVNPTFRNPNDLMVSKIMKCMDTKGWVEFPGIAWSNPNNRMFEYMLNSGQQIDWEWLSVNCHPDAMQMLEANPDKINWPKFLTNPGIFEQRRDPSVVKLLSE